MSKYRHLIYDGKLRGAIKTLEFLYFKIGQFFFHFKLNKMDVDVVELPMARAYDGKVSI